MYRRAAFFGVCGIICGLLVYPTPEDIRWFTLVLSVLYFVLAGASWLDSWSRDRHSGS